MFNFNTGNKTMYLMGIGCTDYAEQAAFRFLKKINLFLKPLHQVLTQLMEIV